MSDVAFCSDSTYTNRTETSNFVMRTRIVSISPKALIHISRLYCPLLNEPRMTARLSRLDKLCKPQLRRLVNAQRHLSQIYRVDPVEVPIESHCLLAFTSKSREPLYPAHRDQRIHFMQASQLHAEPHALHDPQNGLSRLILLSRDVAGRRLLGIQRWLRQTPEGAKCKGEDQIVQREASVLESVVL